MEVITKRNKGCLDVYINNIQLGIFYKEVDGYYVFDVERCCGSFSSHTLRLVANKLDELNKDWAREVRDL